MFFCGTIDYQTCGIEYGEDIDDYTKLKESSWGDGSLLVPTRRTVASSSSTTDYTYFDVGGASWTTPYILGLFAIGLQTNPELTKSDFINYLMESRKENGAIYPEGFVKLVKDELEKTSSYIYLLYNS